MEFSKKLLLQDTRLVTLKITKARLKKKYKRTFKRQEKCQQSLTNTTRELEILVKDNCSEPVNRIRLLET